MYLKRIACCNIIGIISPHTPAKMYLKRIACCNPRSSM